jgi:hypothetical protein
MRPALLQNKRSTQLTEVCTKRLNDVVNIVTTAYIGLNFNDKKDRNYQNVVG